MIEKISLRFFITFMLLCATTLLLLLWFGPEEDSEWFKLMPTFFVLGFASFLIWGVQVVYRFLEKVGE